MRPGEEPGSRITTIFNPRRGRGPSVVVTEEGNANVPNGPLSRNGSSTTLRGSPAPTEPDTARPNSGPQDSLTGTPPTAPRRIVALGKSCCSRTARKIYCGVFVTLCVTASWVGATHFIKMTYFIRIDLPRTNNSSILDTEEVYFNAPFFTTWFCTCWTTLFFPLFFITRFLFRTEKMTAAAILKDSVRNIQERGFTSVRYLCRCSLFCWLWVATNYMYIHSLDILHATDVMALFATNISFVYLLSWVILHEQFVGVRIMAVIMCATGIALLAYMDGITESPTLGAVVLAAAAAAGSAIYKVLFKKVIGEATYGQVALFFTLIGLINALLLWPVPLTLALTGVETLYWETLPWKELSAAAGLALAANLLGNFGVAVTYDVFITLGLIAAVPASAALDIILYQVKFEGMKLTGIVLICIGFFLVLFPDNWPDYITRVLRWGRRRHGSAPRNPHDSIDYRTGYIRSHLRSPSGRVR